MRKVFVRMALILVLSAVLLTSCAAFKEGNFYGGQILDDELMESIRNELFAPENEETTMKESDKNTVSENNESTEKDSEESIGLDLDESSEQVMENSKITETQSSAENSESEKNSDTESCGSESLTESEISDTEDPSEEEELVVYWTKNGSVWHIYSDCGHLANSKEILSGSVNEALEAGKSGICSSCDKKQNK